MNRTKKANPRRNKITDFALIPHGFLREFPGCGNKGTKFKRVVTAVGCCAEESFVNALDQIDQIEGGNLDWTELESKAGKLSTKIWDGREEGDEKECEVWFFYSIRYNLG